MAKSSLATARASDAVIGDTQSTDARQAAGGTPKLYSGMVDADHGPNSSD